MILSATVLLLLLTLFVFANRRQNKAAVKEKNIFKNMGIFLYRNYKKHRTKKNAFQEALSLPDWEMEERYGQTLGYGILLLFLGAFLSLVFALRTPESLTSFERDSFGKNQELSFVVKTEDGEETLSLSLKGQSPSEEEMEEIFNQSFETVKEEILGDNESFQNVQKDLNFIEELENGIRVNYVSSRKDILSDYGYLVGEIASSGENVTVSVILSYEDYRKEYELSVDIFQKVSDSTFLERLQSSIEESEEKNKREKLFVLPSQFEGIELSYEEEQISPYNIFFLFILLAFGLLMMQKEQELKTIRERKEYFEKEYPAFLLKLSMLIHAGISIRSSFLLIQEAYEKKEEKQKRIKKEKEPDYLLAELKQAVNLMNSGVAETDTYISFGRRTENQQYVQLGNLLSQSVRQGVSGLEEHLQEEMKEAISMKHTRALRKGEQAATKQLFPMILMLLVVIIILLVPTLLTF